MMLKNIVVSVFLVFLISCDSTGGKQDGDQLPAAVFFEKVQGKKVQLLDVRSRGEFEKGHLEKAVNIDWDEPGFQQRTAALDKSRPVFVYCLSGGRSAAAAASMRQQGFKKVYEMPGGMMEWRAAKLPETTALTTASGISLQEYQSLLDPEKLTLVDFYADWCGPCKKMEPYLKKLETELADKIVLVRIDADENPELCEALGVTALPTLKLYRNKKMSWSHVGFIGEEGVRKQLN